MVHEIKLIACLDKIAGHLKLSVCMLKRTGVQISDVRYAGIFGTSKSKVAINLNCSQAVACTDILLDTILLAPSTPGKKVISSCNNAYGSSAGIVEPESCLLE